MIDKIRTFIAIELPDNIINAIGNMQKKIRRYGLKIRWVRPENVHITLKFLGDIDPEMIQSIESCLKKTCKENNPIQLLSKGIGIFPGLKRPRVLWAGIGGDTDILKKLQQSLDDHLSTTGIPKEKRPFKGHLTVGRFKGHVDSKKLISVIKTFSTFETDPFYAEALTLYQSNLKPSGAVYSKLSIVPLKNQKNPLKPDCNHLHLVV